MKIIAPDYYRSFKCIADKCRHSCCKGWEIDIDEETLSEYMACEGSFGDRLRANIVFDPTDQAADFTADGTTEDVIHDAEVPSAEEVIHDPEVSQAHFKLGEDERCPFLNEKNLCDIYIELGEQALCQICTDHPRFRNYWTDRTEIGLGMACEEAARIILSQENPVELVLLEEPGAEQVRDGEIEKAEQARDKELESEMAEAAGELEAEMAEDAGESEAEIAEADEELEAELAEAAREVDLLTLRDNLTAILQDRSRKVDDRILAMLSYCGIDSADIIFEEGPLNETACEQLAVYLLYRNYADVLYDDRLEDRVMFVAESYRKVRNEWAMSGSTDIEELIEPARRFSEDIEYDTDTWDL